MKWILGVANNFLNASNCVATLGLKALQFRIKKDVPIPTGDRSGFASAVEILGVSSH